MRKVLYLTFVLLFGLFLVACNDTNSNGNNDNGDEDTLNVEIISKNLEENHYIYVVNITGTFEEDELVEISYQTSTKIYETLMDDIENNKSILTIVFQNNSVDKIELVFNINFSVEHPGMNLISEKIK